MEKIKVFILDCKTEYSNPRGTEESLSRIKLAPDMEVETVVFPANFWRVSKKGCDWFGFLWSSEWLSKELAEALPVFFREKECDFLTLCLRIWDKREEVFRYYQGPRFFRSHLKMKPNEYMPRDIDSLNGVRVLNGWIQNPWGDIH